MAEPQPADAYFHALGHAIAAEDTARAAGVDLRSGNHGDGLAHIADAIAELSAAVVGLANARINDLGADLPVK